jgi:UDP-glucose 4-epimerase
MKVAVFGCNGYIGKHLTNELIKNGHDVSGYSIEEKTYSHLIEYQKVDIQNKNKVESINFDFDQIFFFSGLTGTQVSFDEYQKFIDINEKGLLNMLEAVKVQGFKPKIIYPSTRLVYKGIKGVELKEDSEKEFKTIYALTKFSGENILSMYNSYGISYTIYRICVPYGNSFGTEYSYGTIGTFVREALAGNPIYLYGDGQLKRTFTHVLDICDQIITTVNLPESNNEIYNIAGETLSLLESAQEIANKFSVKVKLIDWPKRALELESGDTIFDSTKIMQIIKKQLTYNYSNWVAKLNTY